MAEALFLSHFNFVFLIARSQKHPTIFFFNQYPTESATGYGGGPL